MEGRLEPVCGWWNCSWLAVIVLAWEPPGARRVDGGAAAGWRW